MTRLIALLAAVAILTVACGGEDGTDGEDGVPAGRLTIFAAASLTDAFGAIGDAFVAEYPRVDVEFSFAGTPTLRTQIEQGARADVFASANREQMELAEASGAVEPGSVTFARNALVIVTPDDNPGGIASTADLDAPGLKLVVAQEAVPAGAYTRQVLESMSASADYGAGFADAVLANVVSLESNVKQVVAKVELGEADAGIVYASDVTAALTDSLRLVELPAEYNIAAEYRAGLVADRRNDAAARAFVDFLSSAAAQSILAEYGFTGTA